MSAILVGVLSVLCYSLAYVLLHRGQVESDTDDNGLFAILVIGSILLGLGVLVSIAMDGRTLQLRLDLSPSQLRGYGFAALSGIIGTLFGRLAVYGAIQRLGATRGIVVESSESLVTLFLAMLILGESLRVNDIGGVLLLALGIVLLVVERLLVQDRSLVSRGIMLGLIGALLQGLGHFVRKLGMAEPNVIPLVAAAVDFVAALGFYVLLLAILGRLGSYIRRYARNLNLYIVAAGFASAAGVLLFFVAVQSVPVWKVAMILGIEPIMVAVLSKLLFRNLERITVMTFVYSLLVTAGIVVLQF